MKRFRSILISIYLSFLLFGNHQLTIAQNQKQKNVGILIFDGVQIIDFSGPYEVFGQAGYNVFTVAEKTEPVLTHMSLDVIPKYNFTNHPRVDILVVPGGGVPHSLSKDNPTIQWISQTNQTTEFTLSVCNGAFLLASAGLLINKEATTYAPMINHIEMFSPNTIPFYDKRFVQSDKIITAGGLSAGIDASLYLVSLDKGPGAAREVANNMEYNWDPDSRYVRSELADMNLLNVLDFNPPLNNRKVLEYKGEDTYWISEFEVKREET
ncbi:MAG: DJ-1/PfpI family protein, partial [Cyclobacteriaceae bacterium]|nr:DJ-1/PfpI family protein [Cyclobacteriaceae bacterium]